MKVYLTLKMEGGCQLAYNLKKKEFKPAVNGTGEGVQTSSSDWNNFFYDLYVEEEYKRIYGLGPIDKEKFQAFYAGFKAGFLHVQNIVEIQTNSLRQSCGLKL